MDAAERPYRVVERIRGKPLTLVDYTDRSAVARQPGETLIRRRIFSGLVNQSAVLGGRTDRYASVGIERNVVGDWHAFTRNLRPTRIEGYSDQGLAT